MERCACKIHSQQMLYVQALGNVDMVGHGKCLCRWCSVAGGSKWREAWKHLGTFSDAIAWPQLDPWTADPQSDVGFIRRNPKCTPLECLECGFDGAEVITDCSSLEKLEQKVE